MTLIVHECSERKKWINNRMCVCWLRFKHQETHISEYLSPASSSQQQQRRWQQQPKHHQQCRISLSFYSLNGTTFYLKHTLTDAKVNRTYVSLVPFHCDDVWLVSLLFKREADRGRDKKIIAHVVDNVNRLLFFSKEKQNSNSAIFNGNWLVRHCLALFVSVSSTFSRLRCQLSSQLVFHCYWVHFQLHCVSLNHCHFRGNFHLFL